MICLILKGGEFVYFINFKLIFILSLVYKIIVKIFVNCMILFFFIWIKKFLNSFCVRKMYF